VRAWEYTKIVLGEVPRKSDEMALLCDAGEDGWELVAILANNVAYLKREVTGSIPAAVEDRSDEVRRAEPAEVNSHPTSEASASLVKPKYRDPTTGETWSGRGRMATWLKRKQDAGEDIDKYLV
jgi:H-NS histone family